jgi:3',5'-cyclic AMP phosphodiesterase CpdA
MEPAPPAPLFRFALLSDTHLNPDDETSSSPWRANRLANRRAAAIVAMINRLQPDFVLHLGDVVHPVPGQPGFLPSVARFRAIFGPLAAPIRCLPGNHDIGDKPTAWMPAPVIAPAALEAYRAALGPDRDSFDHRGCRFVLLNAMLLNSALPDEAVQWAWLETQLAERCGLRAFVFLHYPPFLLHQDEPEHYDNIAEPGRSRLLALLRRHRVEAVFSGHVHTIFMSHLAGTDFHVLPATSAVRHDYSALFDVPPPDAEHGRDNVLKLGFYLVEVFADRHEVHWVRSFGATDPVEAAAACDPPLLHPRGRASLLGVELRHEWARPVSVPYSGVVDEFSRKHVRNDYLTMQLAMMGLRHLRVPLQDALEPETRGRMQQLAAFGHRFTVFLFGLPDAAAQAALAELGAAISRIEIVFVADRLAEDQVQAGAIGRALGIGCFVSRLAVSAGHHGAQASPGRYAHFIRTGFAPDEAATAFAGLPAGLAGLAFRVERAEPLFPALARIAEAASTHALQGLVQLRLAAADPAEAVTDDAATARRVAEAVLAAHAWQGRLALHLDTLADHDRGYFPRTGLIDRRADPRAAGRVLMHLSRQLAEMGPVSADQLVVLEQARSFPYRGGRALLWLPDAADAVLGLPPGSDANWKLVCLDTGSTREVAAEQGCGMPRLSVPGLAPMPRLLLSGDANA